MNSLGTNFVYYNHLSWEEYNKMVTGLSKETYSDASLEGEDVIGRSLRLLDPRRLTDM